MPILTTKDPVNGVLSTNSVTDVSHTAHCVGRADFGPVYINTHPALSSIDSGIDALAAYLSAVSGARRSEHSRAFQAHGPGSNPGRRILLRAQPRAANAVQRDLNYGNPSGSEDLQSSSNPGRCPFRQIVTISRCATPCLTFAGRTSVRFRSSRHSHSDSTAACSNSSQSSPIHSCRRSVTPAKSSPSSKDSTTTQPSPLRS